jgi:hypothetical protein
MYLDFEELLAILNARKVRYLVVGGYAVAFHAQPRATSRDGVTTPSRRERPD